MSRIALVTGAAVAGGLFLPGVGFLAGAAIGASIGQTVSSLVFRPRVPGEQPLQLDQLSSSANGAPIPFGYGMKRFAAQIIWSPGITTNSEEIDNPWPTPNQTIFSYSCSFAAAFGEGPSEILRVWADSRLIYKGGQPFGFFDWWDPGTEYAADDLVAYTVDSEASIYRARVAHSGHLPTDTQYWTPDDVPEWDDEATYLPGQMVSRRPDGDPDQPGQIYASIQANDPGEPHEPEDSPDYWAPLQAYYGEPTIYPGNEAQNPDPLIQAHQGTANTPAFRGICYAVWEDFPLANFGNRLPNIRAEVQFEIQTLAEAITDVCERAGLETT